MALDLSETPTTGHYVELDLLLCQPNFERSAYDDSPAGWNRICRNDSSNGSCNGSDISNLNICDRAPSTVRLVVRFCPLIHASVYCVETPTSQPPHHYMP